MMIRPAVRADVGPLATLHVASWRAAFVGILTGEALAGVSVEEFASTWQGLLSASARTNLVAELPEEGVVGFVAFGPGREGRPLRGQADAEIYGLYVDPRRWGEGIGRELMDAALDRLRGEGRSRACLWVMTENRRARSFYERAGFAATGRKRASERIGCVFEELEYSQSL